MPTTDGVTYEEDFDPTFTGSRQERRWIRKSLFEFWEDRLLTDVLYRVKGGKEATVYCCRAHPGTGRERLAAKVFRPRMFRAMRNDHLYKQGRGMMDGEGKLVYDRRSRLALRKKTAYGKALDTASWCMHEYRALVELHEAGADVPKPWACGPNAILMEFVGDEDGAAPVLQKLRLDRAAAAALFDRLVRNVEILLGEFRVHADLSPYNVLYHGGEIRIIDLPQAVDALRHPDAFGLFRRDVDRICAYFAKQGVETDAFALAHDLWRTWVG